MAIGTEDVETTIQVIIKEKDTELQRQATRRADPFGKRVICEKNSFAGLRDVESGHFIGEIADHHPERIIFPVARDIDTHRATRSPKTVEGNAGPSASFLESPILLVEEEKILNG